MEEIKQQSSLPMLVGISIFLIAIATSLILFTQIITHTGIFHQSGELTFTENVPKELQEKILNEIGEDELTNDLQITIKKSNNLDNTAMLYNIYVPVTDFYDTKTSISASKLDDATLISINELTNTQKLLAIDDNYYLDNLNSGAIFEYIELKGDTQDIEMEKKKITTILPDFPSEDTVLSFAQTGVTALSRKMNAKLNEVKDAKYFSEKISEYLKKFDLTHTSNESSFSTKANGNNICSNPDMIDVITDSGIDIIELTGNHNQDCGDADAIATIDLYRSLGIQIVGGGKNQDEAAIPLEIDTKGNRITMLAYNLSTGGYTLDDTPGANFYTKEKASKDIQEAKARGDFVIVDVQYNECTVYVNTAEDTTCDYANSSAGDQIGFFRELIDMGADLVVGTSAHQPQTFEIYHGKPIYYGLGNLFFDQYLWPGTTRSLVLENYFYQNRLLQTRIRSTVFDSNMQPELMDAESTANFIGRLIQARPKDSEKVREIVNINIEEDQE